MNRKEYKKAMSGIHPSEQVVERIMDMTYEKKENKGLKFKKLASVALAFAILVGTGVGIGTHNGKDKLVSPSGYSIGGIMTVEAKSELKGGTNAEGKYDWGYRIYTKDISGMTKDEIEKAKVDMAKLYICDFDEDILNNEEHSFDEFTLNGAIKDNIYVNGNVMWAFLRGDVEQSLTLCGIDDPSTVKEIRVSNTNDYGYALVNVDDLYYKETEDGVFVRDSSPVDASLTCIKGHDVSVSGDRYLKCRRIESPDTKAYEQNALDKNSPFYGVELATGKCFYLVYEFSDEFFDMLGNNPNYDLSMYTDQINVTVEFKDGKVAENVINVTVDENGKTFCELQSYNYN